MMEEETLRSLGVVRGPRRLYHEIQILNDLGIHRPPIDLVSTLRSWIHDGREVSCLSKGFDLPAFVESCYYGLSYS